LAEVYFKRENPSNALRRFKRKVREDIIKEVKRHSLGREEEASRKRWLASAAARRLAKSKTGRFSGDAAG
jgi:ribosomal protein S21